MVGHLADVIMYAKFQDDIFRVYNSTGVRISHFPIDFCMGLTTVQRCLWSSALSVGFFNRGCTMACFGVSGKTASQNEALCMFASVCASSGNLRLSSHVGIGSNEQCLAGALLTILTISSTVNGLNADRLIQGRSTIFGDGALAYLIGKTL